MAARSWFFTSSDGSFVDERLAVIIFDGQPQIDNTGLSGVSIVKPATLLLKNVNQTYNGTYRFDLSGRGGSGSSQVVVIIASKFFKTLALITPPVRRAWRSFKFAPFLFIFPCRKLGYRSWMIPLCSTPIAV